MKVQSNLRDKETLRALVRSIRTPTQSGKELGGRKIISNPITTRSNRDRDRSMRRAT